jgi:hypothetical protein
MKWFGATIGRLFVASVRTGLCVSGPANAKTTKRSRHDRTVCVEPLEPKVLFGGGDDRRTCCAGPFVTAGIPGATRC